MRKLSLPVFLLLFIFNLKGNLFAASGYYIKLDGDTVKGSFLNVPDTGNPDQVQFNPAGSQETVILKPEEVKAFRVSTFEFFVAYNGTRMMNPVSTSEADQSTPVVIHSFLRQIGEAAGYSFFSYSDQKRVNLFYSLTGQNPVELIYNSNTNSNPAVQGYKSQLFSALSSNVDTTELRTLLNKLEYSEESLITFIYDLNEYSDQAGGTFIKGWILTAGISFNQFSVTGSNTIPVVSTRYNDGSSWLAGFGYFKSLRKEGGRYFIYPNIKVYNYRTSGTIRRFDAETTNSYKCDLVLFPAFNVGYQLVHKPGVSLFLSPGFGFLVLMNNTEQNISRYYDGRVTDETKKKTEITFDVNLKAGIFFLQRYLIWSAYNVPTGTIDRQYYSANVSSVQAGIGYKF
jgi:hypothetical protein